jgi:hypothetical protein
MTQWKKVVALASLSALPAFSIACTPAVAAEPAQVSEPAAEGPEISCPIPMTKPGVCGLHGKVKIVTSFPKYKIKITNSFPDIKVKKVTSFPNHGGEWQFVDSFPDFTVQIVDSFPDFTVQYVDSFPGC